MRGVSWPAQLRRARRVVARKALEVFDVSHETARAFLRLRLPLALFDPPLQLFVTFIYARCRRLAGRNLDAAEARVVQRLFRHLDRFGRASIDPSFLP